MNQYEKRYGRNLLGAVAAYVVLLVISIFLIGRIGESPWRFVVALLPMIPLGWGLAAYLRFLDQMDELQRRIQLNAVAFAAGAVGMFTFTLGLLENVGLPSMSLTWVFPLIIFCWGAAALYQERKYR